MDTVYITAIDFYLAIHRVFSNIHVVIFALPAVPTLDASDCQTGMRVDSDIIVQTVNHSQFKHVPK